MKWLRVSDYCIRDESGRYRICKVTVKGEDIFELWDGRVRIGDWGTAQEAKEKTDERMYLSR